ncbi:MAG: sigma-70 family RNA polymerase sigma factor [Planctomycetes bacterium]|nr:sigma-70 family RNA polymerase sigma factor [Planctomycetota bacterium]
MAADEAPSDAELVRRSRAGDAEAFGALVARHEPGVRRVARSWTPTAADADDLAQTAFLKAWQDLARLEDPSRFRPWIFRIVLNAARDSHRRSLLRPFHAARAIEGADPPDGRDPSRAAAAAETTAALEAAIAGLPEELREALSLHVGEGMRHAEIAEIAGVNEATVRWRLFQARRILREMLGTLLDQP